MLIPYCYQEGVDLPQRVICKQCGYILYDGAELRPPDEILHEHNGKCPKCGKKLALIPINVEVKPIK
jgi:ribosomal protein S27AE